jgi:hypothetical protein
MRLLIESAHDRMKRLVVTNLSRYKAQQFLDHMQENRLLK